MTIALATAAALPGLFADDRLLLQALRRRGAAAEPVIWEDALYDWASTSLVVIRSTWDYAWRREAFLAWADAVPAGRLWNPAAVVRANSHKRYLLALAAAGIPIIPTVLLEAGTGHALDEVLAERGWPEAVIKAAVGQSGRYALRVTPDTRAAGGERLRRLLAREDVLVQPFVPGIAEQGEWSLVFIDGRFTHAVRKRAAPGEFRVHDDYGGTVVRGEPEPALLRLAEDALATQPAPLLYARVDIVAGPDGAPAIMELELIEPELFFAHAPDSAGWLADAILERR